MKVLIAAIIPSYKQRKCIICRRCCPMSIFHHSNPEPMFFHHTSLLRKIPLLPDLYDWHTRKWYHQSIKSSCKKERTVKIPYCRVT
ncbi:hypothetical protein VTL71DRAFT_374 [Oculimacula yallundae]|uniref:Uncharacterized protein n=1 Tax=Oculimacula yallundae TaxID=86028 RepID=A0ABR4CZY3_9HELO